MMKTMRWKQMKVLRKIRYVGSDIEIKVFVCNLFYVFDQNI